MASSWQWWCAKPSPLWWFWPSSCYKDSGQRQPVGSISLSSGFTMRSQQVEHISCAFWVLCSGPCWCPHTCLGPACGFTHGSPVGPASSSASRCVLVSCGWAVSHPLQPPAPLWSRTHVYHPVLTQATCREGPRPETPSGRGFSHHHEQNSFHREKLF